MGKLYNKRVYKNIPVYAVAFFGFLFLGLNIIYSQTLSPLYFYLLKDEKANVVSYLKKIQSLPLFTPAFIEMKNAYGQWVDKEVYAENQRRKERIAKIEALLKANPKARDVLYSLSLLHRENGDDQKADEYLRRAREIDPTIESKK